MKPIKPRFKFELTDKQVDQIRLEEIHKELIEAKESGSMKMIVCSLTVTRTFDEIIGVIEGTIVDNETAAKLIKLINPGMYKKNVEMGTIREMELQP